MLWSSNESKLFQSGKKRARTQPIYRTTRFFYTTIIHIEIEVCHHTYHFAGMCIVICEALGPGTGTETGTCPGAGTFITGVEGTIGDARIGLAIGRILGPAKGARTGTTGIGACGEWAMVKAKVLDRTFKGGMPSNSSMVTFLDPGELKYTAGK
jgi:hypothetical protein